MNTEELAEEWHEMRELSKNASWLWKLLAILAFLLTLWRASRQTETKGEQ